MQDEAPGGARDGVLDQGAREPEPSVATEQTAGLGHQVDAGRDRIRQPDLLQDVERRTVDALDLGCGERPVAAARQAGPDRHLLAWNWLRAQLPPRFPATPAACYAWCLGRARLVQRRRGRGTIEWLSVHVVPPPADRG
jgi:hypothetical protein